jgi:hypothetical protein
MSGVRSAHPNENWNQLSENIHCKMCYRPFSWIDRPIYLLPCIHGYCLQCLKSRYQIAGLVECPKCKVVYTQHEHGECWVRDYATMNALDDAGYELPDEEFNEAFWNRLYPNGPRYKGGLGGPQTSILGSKRKGLFFNN